MDWDDPDILSPPAPKGQRITGGSTTLGIKKSEQGNEEWQALSDKPRGRALLRQIKLGTWERKRWERIAAAETARLKELFGEDDI